MKAQTRAFVWLLSLWSTTRCSRCDCLSLYPFVDQSRVLPDANLQKLRVDRCSVDELADSANAGWKRGCGLPAVARATARVDVPTATNVLGD